MRTVEERLEHSARSCGEMGSAFYARLLMHAAKAARSGIIRDLLERYAYRARIALLFAGAAHFRALHGDAPAIAAHFPSTGGDGNAKAAWDAIANDVRANEAAYDAAMQLTLQTNEPARAMPVLAGMFAAVRAAELPVRVFEAGSSAGFLLNFERYRYDGGTWAWGPEAARVVLRNEIASGEPRIHDGDVEIAERRGCDLSPLDVTDDSGSDRLLSFIWPDQRERFDRARAAIATVREHPVQVDRASAAEWLAERAAPREGLLTVALHTVVFDHLTGPQRRSVIEAVESQAARANRSAPFAWIRLEENDGAYETRATLWPNKREALVARSNGHAQGIAWTGEVL